MAHALQYFGVVWWAERRSLLERLHLGTSTIGKSLAASLFVALPFAYGFGVEMLDTDLHVLYAATLVVAILHFWYDGFIWSVRRQDV